MLFPTIEFALLFFVCFFLCRLCAKQRLLEKSILLLTSYIFYAYWDYRFVLLLLESSLVNYGIGLWLERCQPQRRRAVLTLGVAFNLAILGFFKYQGFFLSNVYTGLEALGLGREYRVWDIILPMGISFFTFQGISYLVDIHRGQIKARRHMLDVMLFISFFPQLVAGPIVRAKDFLPQLEQPSPAQVRASYGLMLISIGLFKKLLLAHYIHTLVVEPAFASPWQFGFWDLLLGAYGYAMQIYCDFSAYSDMAIGLAALLGFELRSNFNQPYRATSFSGFWQRWHISLSSWLRDYLYIPLGGNRSGRFKTYRNLIYTMLLGGLWHGAAWTFVIWGALHGTYLVIERWAKNTLSPFIKLSQRERWFLVFHAVTLSWVFFNATELSQATAYLQHMTMSLGDARLATPASLTLISLAFCCHFLPSGLLEKTEWQLRRVPLTLQGAAHGVVISCLAAMGPGTMAPFIYFRF